MRGSLYRREFIVTPRLLMDKGCGYKKKGQVNVELHFFFLEVFPTDLFLRRFSRGFPWKQGFLVRVRQKSAGKFFSVFQSIGIHTLNQRSLIPQKTGARRKRIK